MSWTDQELLDDLLERHTGIIYGSKPFSKQLALDFKDFAASKGEKVYVHKNERKEWVVITEKSYKQIVETFSKFNKTLETY